MYAIIATGGKQYKVAEGDVIKVEKLGVEAGETVTFDNVIAVSNDGLKVGEDVKDASVTASVVENGKNRKVIVYKYKRKTGYHKKNGHRQQCDHISFFLHFLHKTIPFITYYIPGFFLRVICFLSYHISPFLSCC